VEALPHHPRVVPAEVGEKLSTAVRRYPRLPRHQADHLFHRGKWQASQQITEPVEREQEGHLVLAREADPHQHHRPAERARRGHLECDRGASAEPEHGVAAEVGREIGGAPGVGLDAEVLGRRRAGVSW
jgi:hypothetical protein